MTRVVDASSAVAYLLGHGSAAERESFVDDDVHAPQLLDIEVTQTLRGLVRGAQVDLERANEAREDLSQLRLHRHRDAALLNRAWELRDACTTYDALYVALTEALDATLLTRDAPLARGVKSLIPVELSAA